MLLSIITPYYNTLEYTKKLADVLVPQLTDEVEWIIIDDGCIEAELDSIKANVIHLVSNSGNASIPRNIGLDVAKGDYIVFIDSDDLVSENYIEKIINKIHNSSFDYCYYGWATNNASIVIYEEPLEWNTCVWNCIYKRETIGNNRFDPNINIGEDKYFNELVRKGKRENILDILYYYNWGRPNSVSVLFSEGKIPLVKN